MAKIVKGNIMGVQMYGEVSESDMANFKEFMENIANLKKSLTKLFNEQMAEMAMRKVLGDSQINITEGEVENLEMWETLYNQGLVFKSEKKQVGNVKLIDVI
jgi:hypothetical protein